MSASLSWTPRVDKGQEAPMTRQRVRHKQLQYGGLQVQYNLTYLQEGCTWTCCWMVWMVSSQGPGMVPCIVPGSRGSIVRICCTHSASNHLTLTCMRCTCCHGFQFDGDRTRVAISQSGNDRAIDSWRYIVSSPHTLPQPLNSHSNPKLNLKIKSCLPLSLLINTIVSEKAYRSLHLTVLNYLIIIARNIQYKPQNQSLKTLPIDKKI